MNSANPFPTTGRTTLSYLPGQQIPVVDASGQTVLVKVPNPDDRSMKPLYNWGKERTLRYAMCSVVHNLLIHPLQPLGDLFAFLAKWIHALHDRTAPGE